MTEMGMTEMGMTELGKNRADLRGDLDALVEGSRRALRRARVRDGLARDRESWAPLWILIPGVAFLATIAGDFTVGVGRFFLLFVLSPLPILALLAARVAWNATRPISRALALSSIDRFLGLKERLVASEEFLGREGRTPYMEAALDDAERFAHSGLGGDLHLPPTVEPGQARTRAWVSIAICLLLVSLGARRQSESAQEQESAQIARLDSPAGDSSRPGEKSKDQPAALPPEASAQTADKEEEEPEAAGEMADASELPEHAKRSEGRTGSGRSSHARSASGESDALGDPTREAQTSKQEAATSVAPKKKASDRKAQDQDRAKRKKTQEESGATAGRGSSSGSNKNPASSDWKSRDHVEAVEEEPIEDDAEVDDEEEESEARGGIQPNLRDRRPPVSRDLQIGFGNRPNPDANGRGGPTAQKKSRGVASLVLGVPIPDRIKGRPNAGRTKITQERVEPREEAGAPEVARARTPREDSADPLSSPELTPWMRELVRNYFLKRRERDAERERDANDQP